MNIGAKVYRMALNSAASHGGYDPKSLEGLLPILWLHSGEEVVRHSDYEIALNRILELEEQVRVRGERMEILWQWVSPEYMEKSGQTLIYEIFSKWFDENGKVRDD